MTCDEIAKLLQPRRMLNETQVLDLLPFGRTTLFAMIKDGRFPRGTYISPNRRAWFADDIARWQEAIAAANPHFDPHRPRKGGRRPGVTKHTDQKDLAS
jgi:prophage regulatory protein